VRSDVDRGEAGGDVVLESCLQRGICGSKVLVEVGFNRIPNFLGHELRVGILRRFCNSREMTVKFSVRWPADLLLIFEGFTRGGGLIGFSTSERCI
jgi:hypothetical protein